MLDEFSGFAPGSTRRTQKIYSRKLRLQMFPVALEPGSLLWECWDVSFEVLGAEDVVNHS